LRKSFSFALATKRINRNTQKYQNESGADNLVLDNGILRGEGMKAGLRDLSLDFLRTLAVVGMMAAHTSRLIVPEIRSSWFVSVLHFEPVIPSAFLFLVGLSLALSRLSATSTSQWFLRQLKRALVLWVISFFFYAGEEGWRIPDIFIASGILCTIAISIAGISALLATPKPILGLCVFLLIGIAAFVGLDQYPKPWIMVRVGNSPMLPMGLFALCGALWGLSPGMEPTRCGQIWRWGAGVLCCAGVVLPWVYFGSDALFSKPLGRYDAARIFLDESGKVIRRIGYYNLRPLLAGVCLGIIGLILGLGRLAFARVSAVRPFYLGLGRHALVSYISHLAVLAVLVLTLGKKPLSIFGAGEGVFFGVVILGFVLARARDPGGWFYRPRIKPHKSNSGS
jgi:uncharacterized membrane protein